MRGLSLLLALLLALAAGAAVLAAYGVSPLAAYAAMARAALGSGYGLSECVVKATPQVFTGLAVALPATMQLWNIGADGPVRLGRGGPPGWPCSPPHISRPPVLPAAFAAARSPARPGRGARRAQGRLGAARSSLHLPSTT
jgi:simple sugar transport system permease protein